MKAGAIKKVMTRAEFAAAQELEAQTLLLQSQLDYMQAQDELNETIAAR